MLYSTKTRRERWSDWAGCVAAVGFCAGLWTRASVLGILLAPTLLHNLLIAVSFLIRRSPRAALTTVPARISAYATTVLLPLYAVLVPHYLHPLLSLPHIAALRALGAIAWIVGCLIGIWGVWNLRYAFSIEPQARQLVTTGPYRLARHPIYTAYLLQYAGIVLLTPSLGLALVVVAWYWLAVARIRFEERVLASVFPEYSDYRRRVGMFAPKLFRNAARAPALFLPDSGSASGVASAMNNPELVRCVDVSD